jgi:CHAD domain-containing protein
MHGNQGRSLYCCMDFLRNKTKQLTAELHIFLSEIYEDPILSIHGIRKRSKFLRALIKLNPALPNELTKRLNIMSGLLAPYRDAQVNMDTYSSLVNLSIMNADPSIENILKQNEFLQKGLPDESEMDDLNRQLEMFIEKLSTSNLDISQTIIIEGINRAHLSGIKALSKAQVDPKSEIVHNWRKKTKQLWYQLRFVFGDEMADPDHPCAQSESLGKYLGEIHDLDVFIELLSPDRHASQIDAIRGKRQSLVSASFTLGALLYSTGNLNISALINEGISPNTQ